MSTPPRIDLGAAAEYMAGGARLLDRRRFDAVVGHGVDVARAAVLAALEGYRNPDGGYGRGLEPDLRAAESQPAGALHAFEAMADASPACDPHAGALCDWLGRVSLPDGGLPFALPIADPAACSPFWVNADPRTSSLQITAAVAAQAHRVARWDDAVRDHPWLAAATRYCLDAIAAIREAPPAYVLVFSLRFLDAVADADPRAEALIDHLAPWVPDDGAVPVAGGEEGETLHLLDLSPEPGSARSLFRPDAVATDLDRMAATQLPDGGWDVDFATSSPAAALEWRGHITVNAVAIVVRNGR